jgi:hypothetical protein
MVILGNSNVDCFKLYGGINTNWVGALKIKHFYDDLPIGKKVRSIIQLEDGWILLSIGTHDIIQLYNGDFNTQFKEITDNYKKIFEEFSIKKFGWIVFPQPISDNLNIARIFNKYIERLCKDLGILVINPLKYILGEDGNPLKQYTQKDNLHMNYEGTQIYINEINCLTGLNLSLLPKKEVFEPETETESFCSLLLNNLNIPFDLKSDFLVSLLKDFDDNVISAEYRISLMPDNLFERFKESIKVACDGNICVYGIVLFWEALNETRRGNFERALELLEQSGLPKNKYEFYKVKWGKLLKSDAN